MSRPRKIDSVLVAEARQVTQRTRDLDEYREAMAILLPADLSATLEQTAQLLGVGRATVHRLQSRFQCRRHGTGKQRKSWGGRRRALLSSEEEREFLKPWAEQAKAGGVLVVSPLRAALAQRVGHPVASSVVYRFLARNGWRKVAPDTRHPKTDPQAQDAWKKNCRKCWHAS